MTTIQNNPSVTTLPSATNNSSAAGSASAAISASASSASQIQDQFMTLLVAQMKYQDFASICHQSKLEFHKSGQYLYFQIQYPDFV